MNHPGEIGYLADIARPTVALVNNAQREHQEFMATVEAVARENGSVFAALGPTGVAVFPAGEEFTPLWKDLAGSRPCMTFGAAERDSGHAADIVLAGTEWQGGLWQVSVETPAGPVAYRLHIAGRHNVRNSLAAVACALAAGVPLAVIAQGLEAFEPVKGRSRALAVELAGRTVTLVDDTYNANPDSVRAAIDVLAELPGPRLLVLGDMGEVGDQGPQFHAEVGEHARQRGDRAPLHARATVHGDERPSLHQHRGAERRGAGAGAAGGQRAGQGIALHADGARGGRRSRPRPHHRRDPAMLLSLAQWLQTLSPEFGFLRVFQYLTFRAVMAALTSLLIGLIAGPGVIRHLAELKIGQPVRGYAMETPPDQERHAHHGRRADPAVDRDLHPAVVRPHQPLRLDRAGGDARLRRHRLGRRLAQGGQQGPGRACARARSISGSR